MLELIELRLTFLGYSKPILENFFFFKVIYITVFNFVIIAQKKSPNLTQSCRFKCLQRFWQKESPNLTQIRGFKYQERFWQKENRQI